MKGDINLNLVHQISLRNEMRILRLTKELYNIDSGDFRYVAYNDDSMKEIEHILLEDWINGKPDILLSRIKQKKNNDIIYDKLLYNSLSFDVKVNSKKYSRACFELFDEGDYYTYKHNKDTHNIIVVMNANKIIYTFPASYIEDVVNKRNIMHYEMPNGFYDKEEYFWDKFSSEKKDKNGKKLFFINPEILQQRLRDYIAYKNTNADLTWFYFNAKILKIDKEFEEIDNCENK